MCLPPIGSGAQAGLQLEIFAEGGLGGEVEAIGDLLHAEVGVAEQDFRLGDDILVDPLADTLAAIGLDHAGEVVGGQAEGVGIELGLMLGGVIDLEQRHELIEQQLVAGDGLV